MWRAFFVALGIAFCILGGECLVIEKATLFRKEDVSGGTMIDIPDDTAGRTIRPAEWAPWSLISVGAVTLLYSFTIPRRVAS